MDWPTLWDPEVPSGGPGQFCLSWTSSEKMGRIQDLGAWLEGPVTVDQWLKPRGSGSSAGGPEAERAISTERADPTQGKDQAAECVCVGGGVDGDKCPQPGSSETGLPSRC